MSQFKAWMKRKGLAEDFTDKFKYNGGDPDVAGDYERDLRELVKTLATQYKADFDQFVSRLADERGDSDLKSLFRRTQTDNRSPDPWKPSHDDQDEVVPPEADRGAEMGGAE